MAEQTGERTVHFNLTKPLWRLNYSVNGWQKEVNMVSWNGNKPKLDIREWNADKTKMRKGMTFTKEEVLQLKTCINSIDIEEEYKEVDPNDNSNKSPGPAGCVQVSQADLSTETDCDSEEPAEEISDCNAAEEEITENN